jgi:hypothetical protein
LPASVAARWSNRNDRHDRTREALAGVVGDFRIPERFSLASRLRL